MRRSNSSKRWDGPLNLARAYNAEGRLDEAVAALQRADTYHNAEGFPRWTWAWLSGDINRQQGRLEEAIHNLQSVLNDRTQDMQKRGFDFSYDYEVINLLGQTQFDLGRLRARQGRTDEARQAWRDAVGHFRKDSGNRLGERDRASQSATAVRRIGRQREIARARVAPPALSSRTTTRKDEPNGWPASDIRPPITRPRPSSSIRCSDLERRDSKRRMRPRTPLAWPEDCRER